MHYSSRRTFDRRNMQSSKFTTRLPTLFGTVLTPSFKTLSAALALAASITAPRATAAATFFTASAPSSIVQPVAYASNEQQSPTSRPPRNRNNGGDSNRPPRTRPSRSDGDKSAGRPPRPNPGPKPSEPQPGGP